MAMIRLPNPPRVYEENWANQYTRMLEQENEKLWSALQALGIDVANLELRQPIDAKTVFGLKGNGYDNTAGLNAMMLAAAAGAAIYIGGPSDFFSFATPLDPVTGNKIKIYGDYATLRYTGAGTSADLITFGDGSNTYTDITLAGFIVDSGTSMAGGTAVRFDKCTSIEFDLIVGNEYGPDAGRLYDGVWFNGSSLINLHASRFYTKNKSVIANDGVELHCNHAYLKGAVFGQGTGIHFAGGYGGGYTENTTQFGQNIGVLIDTTISSTSNNQFDLDGAFDSNASASAYLNDAVSNPTKSLRANARFATTSGGNGLVCVAWTDGRLSSNYGVFDNNPGSGIVLDDPTTLVTLRSPEIANNLGWGVSAASPITIRSTAYAHNNGLGDYSPNVTVVP